MQERTRDPSLRGYSEINWAYREIGRRTAWKFLRKTSQDLLKIKGSTTTYVLDLGGVRRLERVWLKKNTDRQEWVILEELPQPLFEARVRDRRRPDGSDDEKTPEGFRLEGGPGGTLTLIVTPTPDADYTTRLDYLEELEELDDDVEPRSPAMYDDTIALLAAAYILEGTGEQDKMLLADRFMGRAGTQIESMLVDVHPNMTFDIDRKPVKMLR